MVLAKGYNRTIRDLVGNHVSKKCKLVGCFSLKLKNCNKSILSSAKLKPVKAIIKLTENNEFEGEHDIRADFEVEDLAGASVIRHTIPKGDTTSSSHEVYTFTNTMEDTVPSKVVFGVNS